MTWIPVSERLPETDGIEALITVLSVAGIKKVVLAWFSKECGHWVQPDTEADIVWFANEVLAWQPLPEPYKEEK